VDTRIIIAIRVLPGDLLHEFITTLLVSYSYSTRCWK